MPPLFLAILLALPLSLSAAGACAQAETPIVVVAGEGSAIPALSKEQAEQLYLGRASTLLGGTPVSLADLPPGATRDRFYAGLTGKNPSQIRAHWSRMVFTGRALPPREVADAEQLRSLLAADPNLIGYLPAAAANDHLKILLRLP
ncbi:hypothetical protein [Aromatoleum sp.]|uniref:hypothetical protein n=1 Tax=Aromatoleum sp. TaxID=2307007 RepID=UPI002FCAB8B0